MWHSIICNLLQPIFYMSFQQQHANFWLPSFLQVFNTNFLWMPLFFCKLFHPNFLFEFSMRASKYLYLLSLVVSIPKLYCLLFLFVLCSMNHVGCHSLLAFLKSFVPKSRRQSSSKFSSPYTLCIHVGRHSLSLASLYFVQGLHRGLSPNLFHRLVT